MTVPVGLVFVVSVALVVAGTAAALATPFAANRMRHVYRMLEARDRLVDDLVKGDIPVTPSAIRVLNVAEKLAVDLQTLTILQVCIARLQSRNLRRFPQFSATLVDDTDEGAPRLREYEEELIDIAARSALRASVLSLTAPLWLSPTVALYRHFQGLPNEPALEREEQVKEAIENEQAVADVPTTGPVPSQRGPVRPTTYQMVGCAA